MTIKHCVLWNLLWVGFLFAAEPMAFLGVATQQKAGETVGLPAGVGLTVIEVVPDSPVSGVLERGDVLHRLGDQLLINPEQLSVLVGLQAPGDKVTLVWRRQGEEQQGQFTLAERPMTAGASTPRLRHPQPPNGFLRPHGLSGGMDARFRALEKEMETMQRELQSYAQGESSGVLQHQHAEWVENGERLVIKSDGDTLTLMVEQNGKQVFKGPVKTSKDLSPLPPETRTKVLDRLESMGLKLQQQL